MSIEAGATLGPYQVLAPLGAGGMGEVYRARDTRLDRTVAIKLLPPAFAADPSLRARFEREARAISSLQHPHVCSLFDVGEASVGGQTLQYLVLEYLDGETLAARLARDGALPVTDALRIAIEICDALQSAHRAGIVHRDLKPANVFLVRQPGRARAGTAKLLDFGLAKPTTPVVSTTSLSMQPTTPADITAQGAILGTFQYMAPEQIEGLEADTRTDIFAFGSVLYEMLTGRPPFQGKTRTQLLASIIRDDPPPVSAVSPTVPAHIDRVVATCLAKEPDERWQSARDLLRELKWAADGTVAPGASSAAPRRRTLWIATVLAGAVCLAAGVGAALWLRSPQTPQPIQFGIAPPADDVTFATGTGGGTGRAPQAAVSPDGRTIVFVASRGGSFELWRRALDSLDARPLPGTSGAAFPFWSPDSGHVAFFANGKLKRVSLAGGPPTDISDAQNARGGAWNDDGVIVFGVTAGALQRVSAEGGVPVALSTLDTEYGETSHRFPAFLEDGQHVLYTAVVGTCCPPPKPGRLKVASLAGNESTTLLQVESSVVYAAGHLLFNRNDSLMAQPIDARSRTVAGDPFVVAEGIATEGSRYATVSASRNGVLVYGTGDTFAATRLTWFDRNGRELATVGDAGRHGLIELSPDKHRVAIATESIGDTSPVGLLNIDIQLLDVTTGEREIFTFAPGTDSAPIWSPIGRQLAYHSTRSGQPILLLKSLDAAGGEQLLADSSDGRGTVAPMSWSRDGRYLLLARSIGTAGSMDVDVLRLTGDHRPERFLSTSAEETHARFSPDGKWVAYQSNETGRNEIFVDAFPGGGHRRQVSLGGGSFPIWRDDGRELFFVAADNRLMSVESNLGETFRTGAPKPLFGVRLRPGANAGQYGVSADGQRFLVNQLDDRTITAPFTVVVNWLAAPRPAAR